MILSKFFDKTLLRFLIVGLINTLVGSVLMFGLYNLTSVNYWLASAANYVIVSVLSFFLNKYFTFRVSVWSLKQILGFISTIVISYLVAYGLAKPLVYAVLADYSPRLQDNIALFVGMCFFTLINYLGQRFVAFHGYDEQNNSD